VLRGSARALLNRKAGSDADGHVLAPEPSSVKRRGPELSDVWQLVVVCHVPCLVFKPVRGGTRSTGY
jgi:hypothetical protein